MNLTREDFAALDQSWITGQIATDAGLYRVPSLEGRDLIGRKGGGDYARIVFPYRLPGDSRSVLDRLRLDHPPVENGKPAHKYLTPSGSRNRLYFPPCSRELLTAQNLPVIITEGEKKVLALWRLALEPTNGNGVVPAFLPIGLPGVWSFRGTTGIQTNAQGDRVPEKGVIPDFDLIPWLGRRVTILYDVNAATNLGVQAARRELARELVHRGADVRLVDLPDAVGVNGCDDFLHLYGPAKLEEIISHAYRYEWRHDLLVSDKGKVLAVLANAITALRAASEWSGVFTWDEFALQVMARRPAPWGVLGPWSDQDDRRTVEWLQRSGILVKLQEAGQAIQTVARDHSYHPVREYLDGLEWDKISRVDDWLTLYAGVPASPLTRAIGARWLISAVARIYQPGCKVDCCLILEGPQGIGKSSVFRILGGPWFCDDIAPLDSKDAALGTRGKWLLEFAELDSLLKASAAKIKAFMSRATDHFRLPYDRRANDFPRECVFAGSVNHLAYMKDETGGRRFWPVFCGAMKLDWLARDRDQLWAEAVTRYRRGDRWWLDTPDLLTAADEEQSERYDDDPWEDVIQVWLTDRDDTSINEILKEAVKKPLENWNQQDKNRVAKIFQRLNLERYRKRIPGGLQWRYRRINP